MSSLRNALMRIKPHKAEAIQRLRLNVMGLIMFVALASLAPFMPSLPTAISEVLAGEKVPGLSRDMAWRCTSFAEVLVLATFSFNILESAYALQYPPAPLPPTPAALRQMKSPQNNSLTPKAFKLLSPNGNPQTQKPFAFSPASSVGPLGSSIAGYPPSPVSTPSRTLQYSSILNSSSSTFASSTSTVGYSPSPSVSFYRGKNSSQLGRPLDGSFIDRVRGNAEQEEEQE
ncbi:hypothetical protein BKA70DRAFT_1556236 [Coprinopsis sp. MPI-PUGE-AT-0042]|nr:hypothetical protein BKA70DRAFT_1556236 [Coprinopsis sp. MPI-PUGE-AT-0042]